MIEKCKADALFSANFTKDRTEFAFYPDEKIINSPWVMWVREKDELKFESFDDLLGKKSVLCEDTVIHLTFGIL